MIRPTLFLMLSALTLSCGSSPKTPETPIAKPNPNPTPGQIELSIASVTLADDCGAKPSQAPTSTFSQPPNDGGSSGDVPMGAMARRACEQSSVQLRVANGTEAPSTITIKKIEVLDDSGAVIGELTPRDASQWTSDTYQPWDQQVAANQVLQVSYALSDPNVQRGGTYTLRVVVAAGDGSERTMEQRTTLQAEASLPPGAVT